MAVDSAHRDDRGFRGTLLPAVAFEPQTCDAADALALGTALADDISELVVVTFQAGDSAAPQGMATYGVVEPAAPTGTRARTLPARPAIELTDASLEARWDGLARLESRMRAERCARTYRDDTLLVEPDGRLRSVYWVVDFVAPPLPCQGRRRS